MKGFVKKAEPKRIRSISKYTEILYVLGTNYRPKYNWISRNFLILNNTLLQLFCKIVSTIFHM